MLPTFLIAGAAKSGSTTLWDLLKAHPEVCMASMKEVNFFITGVWWSRNKNGLDWYASLFEEKPGVKAYGEASINYMSRPESAGLIYETLPEVELIFLLRDPVDRIYSHYWYELQEGNRLPEFDEFLDQRPPLLEEWIWGSRYEIHLKRFQQFFREEQLHVFLFDDLRDCPEKLVKELYQSVGVDENFIPNNLQARLNPTRQVKSFMLQQLIVHIERLAYPYQLPPTLQRPLHKLRMMLRKANASPTSISPMRLEQRCLLQQEFLETIEFVEKRQQRKLPVWRNPGAIEYNFSTPAG